MAKACILKRSKCLAWLESQGLKGHEKWLEDAVTGWATDLVLGYFHVASVEELSRQQVDEVASEAEELEQDSAVFPPLALGLYNVVRVWEGEHDEEVL